MEWPAYRVLCDQPDYWSGWMLDQCVELFEQLGDDTLAARLRSARAGEPLPVPDDFNGPPTTRMYRLALPVAQRDAGLALIERALREGATSSGTRLRGLGGFVEAWREFAAAGRVS